jgi:hypothetical protein
LVQNLPSSLLLSRNLKIRICTFIIFHVVSYGCETFSLTLREEHNVRVFDNRVLRRIFEEKRNEVTLECRKLHNDELHDLHSSRYIIRMGHVARMGEKKNVYRLLLGKPERKRPLRRPRRRWVNNIKLDFMEMGWDGMRWCGVDWSGSA